MSQLELAEKLNIHLNTISRAERSEHFCKPETILNLAKVLNIKPSDLFINYMRQFKSTDYDIVYKIGKKLDNMTESELCRAYEVISSLKD